MQLFRAKVWSVVDIGCLKWSCILFGMIAGGFLADLVKRHIWLFAAAAVLLALKPTISYFGNDEG
jgi:hypothetical protein